MNASLPFKAVLLLFGGTILANPIAVDSSRRPIAMTAENVDIRVQSGASTVQGTYTFTQQKDDWPSVDDTPVIIFVPVFLPISNDNFRHDPPMISLGTKKFEGQIRNDISLHDTPAPDTDLPNGWYLAIYECSIPLEFIDQSFSIQVSYTQPHFKGDISGYVPLNPPDSTSNSAITFHADPGFALKPYKKSIFGQRSYPTIEFKPEDQRLLRVRCINAG